MENIAKMFANYAMQNIAKMLVNMILRAFNSQLKTDSHNSYHTVNCELCICAAVLHIIKYILCLKT